MRKRVVPGVMALACVIAVGVLGGCAASGRLFRPVDPPPDRSVIYFYRHGDFGGSSVTLNINIDGERVGGLKPNGYVYKEVAPASYMVSCRTERTSGVEVLAKPGQSYYIQAGVSMGFLVGKPDLVMVDAAVGRARIGDKYYCGDEPPVGVTESVPAAAEAGELAPEAHDALVEEAAALEVEVSEPSGVESTEVEPADAEPSGADPSGEGS